jgi:oxalate decarboxylase/phosphoglucose isomerase-like protein (cupin superfamily)
MTATLSGRRPDEVPTRVLDWGTIKWLVSPDLDPGAGLTTGEVVVYPGKGHAPHLHPNDEEVIYVIFGEGMQTVGDGTPAFPIKAGDAVYIPANTLHSTYNTTWQPLRLVVIYTPGGAERQVDELPDVRILQPGLAPEWKQDR